MLFFLNDILYKINMFCHYISKYSMIYIFIDSADGFAVRINCHYKMIVLYRITINYLQLCYLVYELIC